MFKYSITDFDFSGKKVRYQGRVLSKFDVAWHVEQLDIWSMATIIMDTLKYSDLVDMLKQKLGL